jgi:proteasome accessory factor C
MSKTAGRLSKILAMLPWVIANEGATVQEVCDRFGYTRKTLIDDLNLVFVCGLPGYGPGELMVAYVDEDEVVIEMADYFSSAPQLTSDQALRLLVSGMTKATIDEPSPALSSALEKLQTVLFPSGQETLVMNVADPPRLRTLLEAAVDSHNVVEMSYFSVGKNEVTTRVVEPWSVFSDDSKWYLSAYCRTAGGSRLFRIDRIESAVVTDEAFEPPVELPLNEVGYVPTEGSITATIKLSPRAFWVAEYYPVVVIERSDGHLVIEFTASGPGLLINVLLRLGEHAELIGSAALTAQLASTKSEILSRYNA